MAGADRLFFRRAGQRVHAACAARERHGLDAVAVRAIERLARRGPPGMRVPIETGHRRANGFRTFAVRHEGLWYPVVYDPATKALVSFLPAFVLDPYRAVLKRKCAS